MPQLSYEDLYDPLARRGSRTTEDRRGSKMTLSTSFEARLEYIQTDLVSRISALREQLSELLEHQKHLYQGGGLKKASTNESRRQSRDGFGEPGVEVQNLWMVDRRGSLRGASATKKARPFGVLSKKRSLGFRDREEDTTSMDSLRMEAQRSSISSFSMGLEAVMEATEEEPYSGELLEELEATIPLERDANSLDMSMEMSSERVSLAATASSDVMPRSVSFISDMQAMAPQASEQHAYASEGVNSSHMNTKATTVSFQGFPTEDGHHFGVGSHDLSGSDCQSEGGVSHTSESTFFSSERLSVRRKYQNQRSLSAEPTLFALGEGFDLQALDRMPYKRTSIGGQPSGDDDQEFLRKKVGYSTKAARLQRGARTQLFKNRLDFVEEFVAKPSCFIFTAINPDSSFRMAIDIMAMLMLVHDAIMVPYLMAWDISPIEWTIGLWSTRLFWTSDLMLSFVTGYRRKDHKLEIRLVPSMKQYLRTWFFPDLCLVLVDWLGFFFKELRLLRITRIRNSFRAIRLIRAFSKMTRFSDLWARLVVASDWKELSLAANVIRMISAIIMINHVVCCGWYALGRWVSGDTGESWIFHNGDTRDYQHNHLYEYATSLHWAITQMTPGSMEVVPWNSEERIYTIFALVFGLIAGSSLIATLSSMMTQYRLHLEAKTRQQLQMTRFLSQHKIDTTLAMAIRRHVATHQKREHYVRFRDVELFNDLPKVYKEDLYNDLYKQIFSLHAFLMSLSTFDSTMMHHLVNHAFQSLDCKVGDCLFRDDDEGLNMYFVADGQLQYEPGPLLEMVLDEGKVKQSNMLRLTRGAWCAEPSLWTEWRHRGDLCADGPSEVLILSAISLQENLQQFPFTMRVVEKYCQAYHFHINEKGVIKSDLSEHVDQDEVMFTMDQDARIRLAQPALDKVTKGHRNMRKFLKMDSSLLTEEVESGKCHVALIRGEVMRTVFVVALRLHRESDNRFLLNICDVDQEKGVAAPTCVLPGTKKQQDETLVGAICRILKTDFSDVADDITAFLDMGSDRQEHLKDSPTYGIRTRYLRTTFDAQLSIRNGHVSSSVVQVPSQSKDLAGKFVNSMSKPFYTKEAWHTRRRAVEFLSSIGEIHHFESKVRETPFHERESLGRPHPRRSSLGSRASRTSFTTPPRPNLSKMGLGLAASSTTSRSAKSFVSDMEQQKVIHRFYMWVSKDEFELLSHPHVEPILREWIKHMDFIKNVTGSAVAMGSLKSMRGSFEM